MNDQPADTQHEVPTQPVWGEQTRRAADNFQISSLTMAPAFISALGLIKASAAQANAELGLLSSNTANAIAEVAGWVAQNRLDHQFPVDVFQTGSGTSTNMNANEVIATLAERRAGEAVHPNDHVNLGQSSNDVIPTAIHVSAVRETLSRLRPAMDALASGIRERAEEHRDVVKTGRTHLMDAMPIRIDQEMTAWAWQIEQCATRIDEALHHCHYLAQGGTAVGTGINAHPEFAQRFADHISRSTGIRFQPSANFFAALACPDAIAGLSGQLRVFAGSLMKICNDLRWMNSGPVAGLGEIALPELQAGSSIMPGKVNPVIPESVAMVCAQVMGNDLTVSVAAQSGNFQLNVMLPVIAHNVLQSIELLSNASRTLLEKAIRGMQIREARIGESVQRNPILITALNARIGYELGAQIAKRAYAEGRPIVDVAAEMTELSRDELTDLLNPHKLT